jgi:hypothetical protein
MKLPPTDPRVAVCVGAPMRDGFVDTTKEIQDSVRDIKGKLQDQHFVVVEDCQAADLIVTVVARGTGSQQFGSRLTYRQYYGTGLDPIPWTV